MTIRFYATRDAYGCFSNFSAHPIELDGLIWPTSEHYFQASKFEDAERREEIRASRSPMIAARLGRSRQYPLRADWEEVKDDVMRRAVLRKFESHPDIARVLLETGDEELVEATTDDHYWGCGTTGTGKNMLGIILMEVRAALRNRTEERS